MCPVDLTHSALNQWHFSIQFYLYIDYFLFDNQPLYVCNYSILIFYPVLWLFLSLFSLTEKFDLQGNNMWVGVSGCHGELSQL